MAVAIVIHLANNHSFRVLQTTSGDPIRGIQRMLGHRNSAVILICGKLPFAVCASAGLVVSAGFVFNEVFVYWFPNFAFASILLASITLLNIFGKKPALVTQVITLAAASIGLLILTGAGLFNLSGARSTFEMSVNFDYRYLAAAGLVLLETEPLSMLAFMVATAAAVTVVVSGVDFYLARNIQRITESQKVLISRNRI
jgi:hypothetical protein